MLVKTLEYDVQTKSLIEVETEMEFPNPRISEIERRMQDIRTELTQSDWKTIKYAEGSLSEEDYQIHITERASLRDEYNTLELELALLIG